METNVLKRYFRQLALLTEYINLNIAPQVFKILPPSPKIEKARAKRIEFSRNKIIVDACRRCAGRCCLAIAPQGDFSRVSLAPMLLSELVYLCVAKKGFSFPEPDWEFLEKRNKILALSISRFACLFLSSKGCLLKDDRPLFCTGFICGPLFCDMESEGLAGINLRTREALYKEFDLWHQKLTTGRKNSIFGERLSRVLLGQPLEELKKRLKECLIW